MTKTETPQERIQRLYDSSAIPALFDHFHYEETMLESHDGTRLRTQFWLPDCEPPFPTVVMRTCYPMQEPLLNIHAAEYAKRGFAFIVQWCRGTGGSEGTWEPNINERADGLSLLNSIQEDDRFGNTGYWGDSYLALTGWVMAEAVPSKVKTMFLGVYGCDRHTSAYKDGLFRQDILTAWAMGNAGIRIDADYLESARYRPQMEVDEKLWNCHLDWYRDWISNTDRDSEYWNSGFWKDLLDIPGKVRIPLFIKEGWYDHHLGSAMKSYERLSSFAKQHSVLQIGPWNHGYRPALSHQPIDNLEDDSVSAPLNWFTRILKEEELPEAQVLLYNIGADQWISSGQWPESTAMTFHLCGQNLEKEPSSESGKRSFTYDPAHPLSSHGAESLFQTQSEVGSLPQPEANYQSDVLSYVSGTLEDELTVCGEISVTLYVSSTAEDTSFTAKLMEVFEDGTAVNIRGTITTLAYRNGRTTRGSYTPGETVPVTLDMWPVTWTFRKGSRLRLDVSSSDFPQYAVHPNKAGVWSMIKETVTADQSVYSGGETDSAVILPVLTRK